MKGCFNMNLKKSINFIDELREIFIDYVYVLDNYFENDKNKQEHEELYLEYKNLSENIQKLMIKYKLNKEIKK